LDLEFGKSLLSLRRVPRAQGGLAPQHLLYLPPRSLPDVAFSFSLLSTTLILTLSGLGKDYSSINT
jgi:hypothetical protein